MASITLTGLRCNADGSTTLIPITVDPDAAPPRRVRPAPPVSGLAFLARITDDEYATITHAAAGRLAASDVSLARWIDMLRIGGQVDLAAPATLAAKKDLVANKLLTQKRADEVFAAQ